MRSKFLILSITICASWLTIYAQNAYNDAKSLSTNLDSNHKFGPNTLPIFHKYYPGATDNAIADSLSRNPFLKDIFDPTSAAGLTNFLKGNNILSSVGGLDVTNIADGLGKFLVERAKQELSITFFQDFKATLSSDKYRHLQVLFKNTWSLLQTIDKDIYQFSSYIHALREAFLNDLDSLFDTFPRVIKDPAFNSFFDSHKPLKEIVLYSLYITKGLKNDVHPGQILEDMSFDPENTATDLSDLNGVLRTIQLISVSLKDSAAGEKKYWVTFQQINQLVRDKITFQIYLGLLYARAAAIVFKDGTTLQSKMANTAEFIDHCRALIENMADKVANVQQVIEELKEKSKKEISYAEYFQFFQSVTDVLQLRDQLIVTFNNIPVNDNFTRFINIVDDVNNLYLDINKKNYSSGIMRLVGIYDNIIKDGYNNDPQLVTYTGFRKALIKYGTFIAQVAQAENSDEVKTAIEAVALPTGSASIKKHSAWNISLNAYLGGFYGKEYIADKSDDNWKPIAGMTAPLGVAISTSLNFPFQGASLSAYIPLIDVGAFASYRFNDSSTAALPKVTLQNIFAPGLGLVYGIPKWPLSIGYVYQFGPALRELENQNGSVNASFSDRLNHRWNFFLAVDIPLLNFYTKSH
jgi:hypothetical protein